MFLKYHKCGELKYFSSKNESISQHFHFYILSLAITSLLFDGPNEAPTN